MSEYSSEPYFLSELNKVEPEVARQKMFIRAEQATPKDLHELFALETRAFNEFDRCEITHFEGYLRDYPEGFILLRNGDGALIAYFVCFGDEQGGYYIESLAVDPQYRGQGVASHIVAHEIIPRAKALGFSKVTLHVDVKNESAVKLYLKHHFQVAERVVQFYESGGDAFYMVLALAD